VKLLTTVTFRSRSSSRPELARAITSAGRRSWRGYMRVTQDAEFAGWTLTYDEVLFVQAAS